MWWKNDFVEMFKNLAESHFFQSTIMFFILFNVVTMAIDGYPPPSPFVRPAERRCFAR